MNYRPISPESYDNAEKWASETVQDHETIYNSKGFHEVVKKKALDINVPEIALQSLVRNASVKHIKKTAPFIKNQLHSLLDKYKKGIPIVSLAREVDFSPYLLARYMVEEMCNYGGKMLSEAMRDPEGMLIDINVIREDFRAAEQVTPSSLDYKGCQNLSRLSMEVRRATDTDPLYGPLHDRERHIVGIEYEVVLEQELHALGVPFETEADLRARGTSKTPDVLLQCPMSVEIQSQGGTGYEWKMISWIDSKAMFGDVATHQTSVLPQAEGYIHRYGPGMVLYWFGHAPLERLGNSQGDIVISAFELPRKFMWPTGEILEERSKDEFESSQVQ